MLSAGEQNYDRPHREGLAVVWPSLVLRPYLGGQGFPIPTDHDALKWSLSSQIRQDDWPGGDSVYPN